MDSHGVSDLVASRICHDVISPLGAIGNGLELLTLANPDLPEAELALIGESVAAAQARLQFFRFAFGSAADTPVAGREVVRVLDAMAASGFARCRWEVAEDPPRGLVRCAFLALLCVETALGRGAALRVSVRDGRWSVVGEGPVRHRDPEVWAALAGGDPGALTAAQVQFMLLPPALAALGRRAEVTESGGAPAISF